MDRTVFLIGFMGTGKTYWGARMAEKLGVPFYDLDAMIETRESNTISGIFSSSGEAGFRAIERETLHQSIQLGSAIIATGGGTPCFFDNMAWMNKAGQTIYLKTPAAILAERLKHEQQFRPLLAEVEAHALEWHIKTLLAHREPFYSQASIIMEQTMDEAAFLDQLLGKMVSG